MKRPPLRTIVSERRVWHRLLDCGHIEYVENRNWPVVCTKCPPEER